MNKLNVSLQHSILILPAHGWSHRRIARELDINRETVGKYLGLARSKPAISTPGSEPDAAAKPAISCQARLTVLPLLDWARTNPRSILSSGQAPQTRWRL